MSFDLFIGLSFLCYVPRTFIEIFCLQQVHYTALSFLISHEIQTFACFWQVFLAAGAFVVTEKRKALVNFTMPISIQTTTLLTARPCERSRTLIFMAPFTYDVSNCMLRNISRALHYQHPYRGVKLQTYEFRIAKLKIY